MRHLHKLFLSLALLVSCFGNDSYAQTVYVSKSDELINLLKQNKDYGTIVLTGNFYAIDSLDVRAGGRIVASRGNKPVIAGVGSFLKKQNGQADGSGYWKIKFGKFSRCDYYLTDKQFHPVLISGVDSGLRNIEYHERDIKKLDQKTRKIAIPIKEELAFLRNKDKNYFRYCTLKLSCWFICMNVTGLDSDSNYIYGFVDADSHYVKIGQHEYMLMYATFFNCPVRDGSAYVDGDGYLHVSNKYDEVYLSTTDMMMNLRTERKLSFDGVRFTAAGNPIKMGNNSKNKSFYNCTFENCGTGLDIKNYVLGADGNIVVSGCQFHHLYSNYAIYILTMKNVLVENNTFSHTGILNKSGAVIQLNGPNFRIEGNVIEDFSYNGIACGLDEKFSKNNISGKIRGNVVDNKARYGDASTQLYDGGGIYVYSHIDSLLIENNIIRNFGFEKGLRFGLYLDGGAYNVISRHNLVYNMYPGQQAVHARYVLTSTKRHSSNVFENNVFVGDCRFGGNANEEAMPTVVRNNYISGETTFANDNVDFISNKETTTKVSGETVYIDRRAGLRKRQFPKGIRRLLKTSKRIEKN